MNKENILKMILEFKEKSNNQNLHLKVYDMFLLKLFVCFEKSNKKAKQVMEDEGKIEA